MIGNIFRRLYILVLSASMLLVMDPALLSAQAKRPQVLVFGDGIDAYAAAIQAAKSNLHTVWIWERTTLAESMDITQGSIDSHQNLDAGIWADLLAGSLGGEQGSDSLAAIVKRRINPQLILNAMEQEIRRFSHLTILRGGEIRSAKKNRRNWRIRLTDGRQFTVQAVVDATADGKVARLAGLPALGEKMPLTDDYYESAILLSLMRTGVAVSDLGKPHPYTVPLGALVPEGGHNIFFTKFSSVAQSHSQHRLEDLPLMAHIGQAIGAAAGYVAFYKTDSDKIEVRQVQAELLQYGARLLPYQDIALEDPHFLAIQRVGATGLFQPQIDGVGAGRYRFAPDTSVSTDELRPVMNQLFSRSQIWFADNHSDQLTLAELMSLIKYIGHRGDELEGLIAKNWERRFKLPGDYDPSMTVTRRHVAVLLSEYAQPFNVRIDLHGRILR